MITYNGSKCKAFVYMSGQYVKLKKGYVYENGEYKKIYSAGNIVTYQVDTNVTYQEEVDSDATCLSPATFTPTKSGYTFLGWREDTAASATVLTEKVMADEPITLYAVFQKTITLSYNGNSSTSGSTAAQTGALYYNNGNVQNPTFILRANGFTRTSYSFAYWAQGSASGTQYKAGSSVTLSADSTFYAYWVVTDTGFNYTGGVQKFTAPVTGTYQLNVYGAQGGSGSDTNEGRTVAGGKGGYANGNVVLAKGQVIYVVVGGAGKRGSLAAGGYNGGGSAGAGGINGNPLAGSGGGATHIAKVSGLLSAIGHASFVTNKNGLIVAGGGGGAPDQNNAVGTGGGLNGGNGYRPYDSANPNKGGTQTTGYAFGKGQPVASEIYYCGGGGGGLYGGYATAQSAGGGGGSGYIGGVSSGSTSNGARSGNGYALIRFVSAS